MSSRRTLPRLSKGNSEVHGILSPKAKQKGRNVRFEFPTQLTRVRNISQELDEMASSQLFAKSKSVVSMPKLKPRLLDAPISLAGYKSHIRTKTKEELHIRISSLVMLPGGRMSHPNSFLKSSNPVAF